jgi:hypothetical protein
VGTLLTVFVPAFSSTEQRNVEKQIAKANQQLESLNRLSAERTQNLSRQVEITRLLFDHYFGKPAGEQTAVVSYLRFQFPRDLSRKSLQAILNQSAKHGVRTKITRSVAVVERVRVSNRNTAVAQERIGFLSLVEGDLPNAKRAFGAAYRAFPTYHNVDEISHRVLTGKLVMTYSQAPPALQQRILKFVLSEILSTYSWGIPRDLLPRMQATLKNPASTR